MLQCQFLAYSALRYVLLIFFPSFLLHRQITGGKLFFIRSVEEAISVSKDLSHRIIAGSAQSAVVRISTDSALFESRGLQSAAMRDNTSTARNNRPSSQATVASSSQESLSSSLPHPTKKKQKVFTCGLTSASTGVNMWPIPDHFSSKFSFPVDEKQVASPSTGPSRRDDVLFRVDLCDLTASASRESTQLESIAAKKGLAFLPRSAQPLLGLHTVEGISAEKVLLKCKALAIWTDSYHLALTENYQLQNRTYFEQLMDKIGQCAEDNCVLVHLRARDVEMMPSPLDSIPSCVFGILHPTPKKARKKAKGDLGMTILPFNFHILVSLLDLGLALRGHPTERQQSLSTWRHNVTVYMQSVPPYYQTSIWSIFGDNDLVSLASLPPKAAFAGKAAAAMAEIHAAVSSLEQLCLVDLIGMDSVTRYEGYEAKGTASVVQSKPVAVAALQSTVEREIELLPQCIAQIHANDLLSTWDRMRKHVFGGVSIDVLASSFDTI